VLPPLARTPERRSVVTDWPKPNDRIRLAGDLVDDPDPIPVGATGVVVKSHPLNGRIGVLWDPPHEGRRLFLLSTDPWEVIPSE
jgi:hypothetical protein